MREESLEKLVGRFRKGDTLAFEEIYRETSKFAFFHAKAIVKEEEDAWELVQETYLTVYRNISSLREDRYIKSWIGGIIFNLGNKKLRGRREIAAADVLLEEIENEDRDTMPEEAVDTQETTRILREALEILPPLQKTAIIAYYFDEMSVQEIADCFSCSENTIKSRLNYARKSLRLRLEEEEKKSGVRLHSLTLPTLLLGLRAMYDEMPCSQYIQDLALAALKRSVGIDAIKAVSDEIGADITAGATEEAAAALGEAVAVEEVSAVGSAALSGAASTGGFFAKHLAAKVLLTVALIGAGGGGVAYYRHHMAMVEKQNQLSALVENSGGFYEWLGEQKQQIKNFTLTEEERNILNSYLEQGKQMAEDDYDEQIAFVQKLTEFEAGVQSRLDTETRAQLEELKKMDPGYATEEQLAQLSEYAKEGESLLSEGKYKKFGELETEWRAFAASAAEKKTGFEVAVMQYDVSEFPTIRLYLDVRDTGTGETVKNLSPNMFFVSEKDAASGNFLRRSIDKAVLLNENEGLNIDLLADTSGSMLGRNMEAAKEVMKHFISTVQFGAGDRIKMTQFNSDIDKSGYFTSDASAINQIIDSYSAEGGTKLYDSIIYGVQDVSGQEGAKCVLAFTDGIDEHSYNTAEDVVEVVSRYNIPVFIVRIGDSSTAGADDSLQKIAQASGGNFKNLSEFSSDMNTFYSQIYRQMKEYYVVEYKADSLDEIMDLRDISVYVQNGDKGGETREAIDIGEEFFETLLGSYLRSYITDMNNHHYEALAQYVDSNVAEDDTWSIQWQMRKQVSGGFANVTEETLMDYRVTGVEVVDDTTIHLKAEENYDVVYDENGGELLYNERRMTRDVVDFMARHGETLTTSDLIRVWARVNQKPEYILKKGNDGKWKFSKYAESLTLDEKREIYRIEKTGSEPFEPGV